MVLVRAQTYDVTTGTYSKVLGRFVREQQALTLMDAIKKMTLMPARRLEARVPGDENEATFAHGRRRGHRDCRRRDRDRSLYLTGAVARPDRDPSRARQRRRRRGERPDVDGVTPGQPVRAPAIRP